MNTPEPRDPDLKDRDADQVVAQQPAVAQLLDDAVASHRSLLGSNLVGIYLHGSRATGDHGPRSDIDYLVVVERGLVLAEKRQLVAKMRELSKRAPAHGIEMSVITSAALRRFRHPAPLTFHFSSDWLRRYDRGLVDLEASRTDADLASHVTQTRERGQALYGEPIDSVFPRIDRAYHVEGTLNDAKEILSDPAKHPLYTALNLCRALAVIKGAMSPSKIEAVEWALANIPEEHHPLIREARRRYRAGADGDGLDQHQLASFAIYMECALGLGVAETGGMPKLTTRLARHGPRAAFQVRVEDPRLEDVLLKMGFTRAGEDLERSFPDSERIPDVFRNFSRQIGKMLRHQTGESAPRWDVALREVHERLEGHVDWWLSGSAALAVRGIDVVPRDLDLVVGDARATAEALEDILVEPVRQMPGWLARWFGRAFHGALIEWVAEVDPEVDRQGPHEQGPLAQGALEDVVWEGRRIRCTPLRLQLAVAERRGRVEAVEAINASQQLAGQS